MSYSEALSWAQVLIFNYRHSEATEPNVTENNNFKTLKEQERAHILQALQQSRWKINGPGGAAQILDINASTLAFRMKKLGIKKPEIYTS